jgi:hypothetical protein
VANLQTADAPDEGLKHGSLADMYALSQDPENSLILNALDIPMGESSVEVPPHYR